MSDQLEWIFAISKLYIIFFIISYSTGSNNVMFASIDDKLTYVIANLKSGINVSCFMIRFGLKEHGLHMSLAGNQWLSWAKCENECPLFTTYCINSANVTSFPHRKEFADAFGRVSLIIILPLVFQKSGNTNLSMYALSIDFKLFLISSFWLPLNKPWVHGY